MKYVKYKFTAHRGLHNDNDIPENSLPAFEIAIKKGYPIELDVHLTSDKELVVFHDENLKRMTGVNKIIENCQLSELKKMNLNGTKQSIPTLDEVLELVNCKVPLLIEIKNEYKVGILEDKLISKLSNYKGEYIIESFNPLSLLWIRKRYKNIILGQLVTKDYPNIKSVFVRWLLKNMFFNFLVKPDFIAYDYKYINNKLYKKFKNRNIDLFLWTIRNNNDYKSIQNLCDGIIFENFIPNITNNCK